jgi:hypothetical protein
MGSTAVCSLAINKKRIEIKLSKRDGDKLGFQVFPLEWKTEETTATGYRENGFFQQ